MLKLNRNYSDYTDETDPNYPEGKAINATTSESYDGTPCLDEFMNDLNASHIAMYEKAYGSREGISGKADTQKASQFADAVAKYTDDKVKAHADKRGLTDGVHGATSEATAGQLASRDEYGNLKVGYAIDDEDAVNRTVLSDAIAQSESKLGSAAGKTAGSASGNVPVNGSALGTTNNNIVVTDANGNLKPSGITIGSAAGKTAGSAYENVPIIGKDLGSTYNGVVVTDSAGRLKPAGITYENMMSASNAGALCSTAKTTQAKTVTLPGFTLYAGVTVKVMFTNGNSASNPTLNVNNTGAKSIKVVNAGAKIAPVNHFGYWRGASSMNLEMWQPYTILEFMYDGADWVIVGNPTVESYSSGSAGYTVKADGLIEQWIKDLDNGTSNLIVRLTNSGVTTISQNQDGYNVACLIENNATIKIWCGYSRNKTSVYIIGN